VNPRPGSVLALVGFVAACGGAAPPSPTPTVEVARAAPPAPPSTAPSDDVVPAPTTPEEASLLALSRDEDAMLRGRGVYERECAVCHGPAGRGSIGPSLVDDTFLHGGRIADLERVVKLGAPSNGMPMYGAALGEEQASLVTAYLLVLMREARTDEPSRP